MPPLSFGRHNHPSERVSTERIILSMQTANLHPHVTVTGRHLAITAAIHDYAERKVERPAPRLPEDHRSARHPGGRKIPAPGGDRARVRQSHHHRGQRGEQRPLRLDGPGHLQNRAADAQVQDPPAAFAPAARAGVHPLPRRTGVRPRGVRRARRRRPSPPRATRKSSPLRPRTNRTSCRRRKYPVKPMYVDEAVLQMEMSAQASSSCS